MKNSTARKIEERLLASGMREPPAELLETLKEDIPDRLVAAHDTDRVEVSGRPGRRPGLRLLAASVFLAVVGGVVAYRVMERTTPLPEIAMLDESPASGKKEEVFEADAVAPAEEAAPILESAVREKVELPKTKKTPQPSTPSQTRATAPAPPEERKRDTDDVGALSQLIMEEANDLPDRDLGGATGRTESEGGGRVQAAGPSASAPQPMRKMAYTDEVRQRSLPTPVEPPRPEHSPAPGASPSTGGTHEPNDQPYGDMFFRSYGVNPFVDTEDDRFSTFGLDVDTGSYTVVRGYLQRGHLPPSEAVRVEEFINYFDYGDRAPRDGDFGLTVDGAPSPFAEGPRYQLIRFGLAAREVDHRERERANLVFVVDVSGSMEREGRLVLVRQSLDLLLDELREGDRVGLVVYGSRGQVLLEPTGNHEAIRSAIGRLVPGGSTNAEEGLVLAYEMARRHYLPDGINRLILCSDGVANVGRTGADSILDRVAGEADRGIALTTVGFGMGNYNDVLMEQLADRGDGNYAYVDNLGEARRIFVESLTGTLLTVARDAKVQVEFNPEIVSRYRLLGYENRDVADDRFRDDTVDAGEIGAGHQVTALYEVKLAEDAPRKAPLATFRIRYQSTATDRVEEFSREVTRRDLVAKWDKAPSSLRLAALVAEFAEILKGAYWAREGNLGDVFRRTQALAAELAGDAKVAELAALAGKAAELAGTESGPER